MRPARIPWRALLRAGGLALGIGLPVAALAYVVRSNVGPVARWDQHAIVEATDFTRARPRLHDALIVWQAGVPAALGLPRRRRSCACGCGGGTHQPGRALWGFATLMAAWLIANLSKELVRRARPVVEDALVHAGGTSFPSGHAFAIAATGTTVTLLLWPMLGPRGRVVVPTIAAVLTLATGADRVLLGAHYPSDVVGGILLGATVSGASYIGYRGWTALRDDTPDPEV